MNNQDFIDICKFVHGTSWQNETAADLNINIRTIQYWSSGKKKVPDDIAIEICAQAANKLMGIRASVEA